MKFKINDRVKVEGFDCKIIHVYPSGNQYDVQYPGGGIVRMLGGELLTDDQPEVKIERLLIRSTEPLMNAVLNKINQIIDHLNALNFKEEETWNHGSLLEEVSKVKEENPKEDWEKQFKNQFIYKADQQYKSAVSDQVVPYKDKLETLLEISDFIRDLLEKS